MGKKILCGDDGGYSRFFIALVRAFRLGKKTEQQKQTETLIKRAITRLEIENEVNKQSDGDVRSDLSQWVRK
ncbi:MULTISPECIES: hypothetical protein [Bartonella]|uniref:Uncharacterized protein n=1 Tax=Bartonella rochalimae ATCC BAA-1498 TaxID=685782 RepID=A0A067WNK6_9HYPH|nr:MULTISPECIES: hypothetical protein [Bartonella]AQX22459.1 hypothetical protein Bho11B_004340 [Bartonella sp. 11B]AQX17946.1 hypothetical protein BA1379B_000960 [Bartonella sp. A1379B]AQX24260.1 hypothetical protein Bho114_009440 [Bartonella sp. 114]AQX24907.1 hypothetical protein Bco22_002070 [Bartonella sp. Coyote22sub2]KEC57487.1 hypothetical protein O99_00135 [Bartonella rochalimae ATCC BAA-1498]